MSVEGREITDADILAWADRHDFHGRNISELRDAFEDAQSFATTAGTPTTKGETT